MRFCNASYPCHGFGTVDKRTFKEAANNTLCDSTEALQTAEHANHWEFDWCSHCRLQWLVREEWNGSEPNTALVGLVLTAI